MLVSSDILQDYLDGHLDDTRAEIVERALNDREVSTELERLRENARALRSRSPEPRIPDAWLLILERMTR